jgi:hypothetical protein
MRGSATVDNQPEKEKDVAKCIGTKKGRGGVATRGGKATRVGKDKSQQGNKS